MENDCDCVECLEALKKQKQALKLKEAKIAKNPGINGTVKWYNRNKGYGFVEAGGASVFFHHSVVSLEEFSKKTKIKPGTRVKFWYDIANLKQNNVYKATKVEFKC